MPELAFSQVEPCDTAYGGDLQGDGQDRFAIVAAKLGEGGDCWLLAELGALSTGEDQAAVIDRKRDEIVAVLNQFVDNSGLAAIAGLVERGQIYDLPVAPSDIW